MYDVVDALIQEGYSDICVVSYRSVEEKSGFQDEHEYWDVVARERDGVPVRISAERHTKFGPRAGPAELRWERGTPISDEQFKAIAEQKGVRDTPEYRRQTCSAPRGSRTRARGARACDGGT